MPLAGRELPGPEWFANGRAAGGEETFGLLRGALEQVGALAALSAEVFDNLLRLSGETHERVASAAARADRLARRVGAADAAARRAAAFRCGAGRGRELVVGAGPSLLTPSTRPDGLVALERSCAPPPPLDRIDKAMGGRSCAHAYSDPSLFVEQWMTAELNRQRAAKAEKKAKRAERKARRAAEKERRLLKASAGDDDDDDDDDENARPTESGGGASSLFKKPAPRKRRLYKA